MAKSARALAAEILGRCTGEDRYSNLALDTVLNRTELNPADRALLTALVYGVIEKQLTLDYYISILAKRPTDEIAPAVQVLLRIGLYQLAYMDRIPMHAAVNETVELAPKRAKALSTRCSVPMGAQRRRLNCRARRRICSAISR